MAADSELISTENFNLKFKNYLRDFYIYQFKERGADFKARGTNDKTNLDKEIIDGTFYPDVARLRFALEGATGVTWSKGQSTDKSGKVRKGKENKRVECVTIDSRSLSKNPFSSLYRYCSEGADSPGAYYAFVAALIIYFNLGSHFEQKETNRLSAEEITELNEHFREYVCYLEGEERRGKAKQWFELSQDEKNYFSEKVISRFMEDPLCFERVYGNVSESETLKRIHAHITKNNQTIVFADNAFSVKINPIQQRRFVEKSVLFEALGDMLLVQKKQFSNRILFLTQLGILDSKKEGTKTYYSLSSNTIDYVFDMDEDAMSRLAEMVHYFSQISMLGEVGEYISCRLGDVVSPIKFKHNYIKRSLNDYNNIDLLYAIKNKLWAFIEYRNASMYDMKYQSFWCFPLQIRESVIDGRQYLLYYHSGLRSVSAIRIEFIDSITLGKVNPNEYFESDIENARWLINNTWGTSFDKFQEGNVKERLPLSRVKLLIKYDEGEGFIERRVRREIRHFCEPNTLVHPVFGDCMEFVADIANPWEALHWVRSFTTRVAWFEIDGITPDSFAVETEKAYDAYMDPSWESDAPAKYSNKWKSMMQESIDTIEYEPVDCLHPLLFNELFGISFQRLCDSLSKVMSSDAISETLDKERKKYVDLFTTDHLSASVMCTTEGKRVDQFDFFFDNFVSGNGENASLAFKRVAEDKHCGLMSLMPLSSIEMQWMNNILHHPLAKCFLTQDEIARLLERIPDNGLFDVNSPLLYDQFIDLDDILSTDGHAIAVSTLLAAIRENKKVALTYVSQYNRKSTWYCYPSHLEYSKRDNCFRLYALTEKKKVRVFNLERVQNVLIVDSGIAKEEIAEKIVEFERENERHLVVLFSERKNIPDKILTEFSPWKKSCIKAGKDKYRMSLVYDADDSREIVVRLLSYGADIFVADDDGTVRHELIKRLEKQLGLNRLLEQTLTRGEPR